MTAIGATIYKFDENRREYRRNAEGRPEGGPIFEKHFVPHVIVGETKQSWLVIPKSASDLLPQKTDLAAYMARFPHMVSRVTKHDLRQRQGLYLRYYTAEGMAERVWQEQHRPEIVRRVQHATTAQLKKIAEIVGL